MESEKKMSKLQEEIKKLKEKQGGELLKPKDRQTEIVKFDLDVR
jgi:membrane protein insertase Oxa1/YidC/SpoIIIJ